MTGFGAGARTRGIRPVNRTSANARSGGTKAGNAKAANASNASNATRANTTSGRTQSGRTASSRAKSATALRRGAKPAERIRRPSPRPVLQPIAVTGAVAVIIAAAYLLAPRMGWDLSAQIARADFARDHPLAPVDFRWFGGSLPFGYSLFVPVVAAHVGVELLGAIAAVAGSMLTAAIFVRTGVRRPVIGGVLAAVTQGGNLTEGRVAFGVGLAFALVAVLTLTSHNRRRRPILVLSAVLAGTCNPVAALLLGVVALTLLLHRRYADTFWVVVPAAVGVAAVSGLFNDGGMQIFGPVDAARAAAVTVLVGVLTPTRFPLLRTGAAVGVVMVAAAYFLDTPVGGNAARLSLLFAVPVVAAVVELKTLRVIIAVVAAAVIQTPITFGTIADAGSPATRASYFTPLTDQILARGPLNGRVEIPELNGHWEAAYAARDVPLARGWLRQVDTELNSDVFYDAPPTADTYQAFLRRTATAYVAVPTARLTFYGQREADLIGKGLPYLTAIWTSHDWTLYTVNNAVPLVASPAVDPHIAPATITFNAPAASTVVVKLRWFDWLSLDSPDPGACLARRGNDVVVRTQSGGTVTISSTLAGGRRHCQDA